MVYNFVRYVFLLFLLLGEIGKEIKYQLNHSLAEVKGGLVDNKGVHHPSSTPNDGWMMGGSHTK